MLVAMATGTGKTFTMVNLIYRLMKAGAAKRVLFLVDRRALAAQAVRAFASFDTEQGLKFDKTYEVYSQQFQRGDLDDDDPFDIAALPNTYLTDPRPGHAFVYVSTIQRMTINLFGKAAAFPCTEEAEEDAEKMDIRSMPSTSSSQTSATAGIPHRRCRSGATHSTTLMP
jgi:type I restriction enzyme R subunit